MADESKSTGDQSAGESTDESSSGQSPVAERAADARSADFALICSQRAEVGPLLKHIDRQRKYVDDGVPGIIAALVTNHDIVIFR